MQTNNPLPNLILHAKKTTTKKTTTKKNLWSQLFSWQPFKIFTELWATKLNLFYANLQPKKIVYSSKNLTGLFCAS